jgi:hypothetical protein
MSKKYLLIELSYEAPNNTSADAVLHNVYIDINHPENLAMFSESCKNRHEINENLPICQLITSWVRLLGSSPFWTIQIRTKKPCSHSTC